MDRAAQQLYEKIRKICCSGDRNNCKVVLRHEKDVIEYIDRLHKRWKRIPYYEIVIKTCDREVFIHRLKGEIPNWVKDLFAALEREGIQVDKGVA